MVFVAVVVVEIEVCDMSLFENCVRDLRAGAGGDPIRVLWIRCTRARVRDVRVACVAV